MPRHHLYSILLLLLSLAQPAQAQLRIERPVIDVGPAKGGIPIAQKFELINTGTQAVEIIEVERDCGCMEPTLSKRSLQPGEKSTMQLHVRTIGHLDGEHTWQGDVRYRQGTTESKIPYALRATLTNDVTVEPAMVALYVETTLQREILITDRRPTPLKVTIAQTSLAGVSTAITNLNGRVFVNVKAVAANLEAGKHEAMLTIHTDDPLYADLSIPIVVTKGDRAAVTVLPAEVNLHLEATQQAASQLIQLRPHGDRPVTISHIDTGNPALSCTWAAGTDGGATIRIRGERSAMTSDTVASEMRVQVSSPEASVLTIQVRLAR